MRISSLFSKRGRGQIFSKKRLAKKVLSGGYGSKSIKRSSYQNGSISGVFTFFWWIFKWFFKIGFWPFTLIYYGFIKKEIKTKSKIIFMLISFLLWSLLLYVAFEDYLNDYTDFKFDGDFNMLVFFIAVETFIIYNTYTYFKNGDYKNKISSLETVNNSNTKIKTDRRRSLTQSVKDRVWNRDGGKCVECGSNENLEFDHIIPFSKGGANTYRNIQLLCESCNRSKSDNIG